MRRNLLLATALVLVSASPLWAPNCKKGKPCGNSCIPMSSTCHIGSSPSYAPSSASGSSAAFIGNAQSDCAISSEQQIYVTTLLLRSLGYLRSAPSTSMDSAGSQAIVAFQTAKRLNVTGQPSGQLLVFLAEEVMNRSSVAP